MQDPIYIRPMVSRNRLTSLLFGGALLILVIVYSKLSLEPFWPAIILLTGVGIVFFLIGVVKLTEPEHSFILSGDGLTHYHRRGQWSIPWQQLTRAGVPVIYRDLQHQELPYIGFKIDDIDELLKTLPLRFMSHLLMEQRNLYMLCIQEQCQDGNCGMEQSFETKPFECKNGDKLTGLRAMFGHRMVALRQGLGFDLFVASSSLDRNDGDFVALIKQFKDVNQL